MTEKKFTIKHVFENIKTMESDEIWRGEKEGHFDAIWLIKAWCEGDGYFSWGLECPRLQRNPKFEIQTRIESKIKKSSGENVERVEEHVFDEDGESYDIKYTANVEEYLINGNVEIECVVTIKKMKGIKGFLIRAFDESAKEFSDVVLVAREKKFHVNKMFLASHSPYFNTLFFGPFAETHQPEIELKGVDPWNLQNFLELIHGETDIDDETFAGILKLAHMFLVDSAKRKCELYLESKKTRFNAEKRHREQLKEIEERLRNAESKLDPLISPRTSSITEENWRSREEEEVIEKMEMAVRELTQ